MSRDENHQRQNETDCPSFVGFHVQLVCQLSAYSYQAHTQQTLVYSFVFKTLTEQNRNDENYKQTGINFNNFYKSRCQNNCDPSSSWRSLVIVVKQASEITLSWTIKSLFWYPFRCVEWKATWVTTAEFTDAFTQSNLYVPVNSVVVHS